MSRLAKLAPAPTTRRTKFVYALSRAPSRSRPQLHRATVAQLTTKIATCPLRSPVAPKLCRCSSFPLHIAYPVNTHGVPGGVACAPMGGSNETPRRVLDGSVKVGVMVVQKNRGVKARPGEELSAVPSGVGCRMGEGGPISGQTRSALGERCQPSSSWEGSGPGRGRRQGQLDYWPTRGADPD